MKIKEIKENIWSGFNVEIKKNWIKSSRSLKSVFSALTNQNSSLWIHGISGIVKK